jgi:NTE family protein
MTRPRTRRQPRIGLALGSGSARGWAHIGVIRAIEERGIKPEIVCGTSIGALVGAAYAAGELERLERWVSGLDWTDVLKLVDVTWRGGLIRGQRLFDFFRVHFDDRDIGALGLAYAAVATELSSGREVWLREGSVLDAVRASIAIPGVFAPMSRDGEMLVDGGLVNPIPVSVCRALGAEIVIAVDLGWAKRTRVRAGEGRHKPQAARGAASEPGWLQRFGSGWLERLLGGAGPDEESLPSIIEVFLASIDIVQERVARSRLAGDPADVLVMPRLPDIAAMEFHRAREAIKEGHAAVGRAAPLFESALEA